MRNADVSVAKQPEFDRTGGKTKRLTDNTIQTKTGQAEVCSQPHERIRAPITGSAGPYSHFYSKPHVGNPSRRQKATVNLGSEAKVENPSKFHNGRTRVRAVKTNLLFSGQWCNYTERARRYLLSATLLSSLLRIRVWDKFWFDTGAGSTESN